MREPLIFDTSVWVDFLNKKQTQEALFLEEYILADGEVLLTPTILLEILQGIREDSKYSQVRETLSYFRLLELPAYGAAIGTADLYRALCKQGITIRKSNECLIAYYAIWFSVPLVHTDRDFDQIGLFTDLKVWTFNQ